MGRYLEFLCVFAGREFLHAGSEPADGADCFFKGLLQPVDLFLLTDKGVIKLPEFFRQEVVVSFQTFKTLFCCFHATLLFLC